MKLCLLVTMAERELPYSQEEITEQAAKKNVMINNYVKEAV